MDRQGDNRFVADIAEALGITHRFHRFMGVPHFFCGVDPIFAGLHNYATTVDGRTYRETAHCALPAHQVHMPADRRRTTVVLPKPQPAWVIVHELGHALDEALGADFIADPITRYAATNRQEAFAEAFTGFFYRYGEHSPKNVAYFAALT